MPNHSPQLRPVLRSVRDDGASPPKRRNAVRNRAALIDAARELFAAKGFATGMDEIAERAGLGVGTAYRHFTNKYDLANAIFDDVVIAFVDAAEKAIAAPDPWRGLVTVIEHALQMQTGNRGLRQILLGAANFQDNNRDLLAAEIGTAFDAAKAAGVLRPDVESTDIAMILTMLCALPDATTESSPIMWRRYLPALLEALRNNGIPLPAVSRTTSGVLG